MANPTPAARSPPARGVGGKVSPLSAYDFYEISRSIDFLRLREVGDRVCQQNGRMRDELGNGFITLALNLVLEYLEQYGWASSEVPRFRHLLADFEKKYAHVDPPNLDREDSRRLSEAVTRLEPLLSRDLIARNFFEPQLPDGNLPYDALKKDGAKRLFRGRSYPSLLPQLVRDDLEESVRCLINGQSTASSMISLRAAEGMMREVYRGKLNKPAQGVGWKTVEDGLISYLNGVGRSADATAFSSHLTFLRGIRNEVEHPQERYDTEQAERALTHSIEVISELAKIT